MKNTEMNLKYNTNPHLHPCTDTQMRRTCGPKIGFVIDLEVEILYLCLILLKPISYYKLIIDYDLNLIDLTQS